MFDDQGETRFPPMGGKYASVNDAIGPLRDAGDIASLRAAVDAEPQVLGRYEKHGTFGVLTKWAAKKESVQDELDAERAARIMTIKKDGPDRYRVYANSDDVFEPVLVHADRRAVRHLVGTRRAGFATGVDPMVPLDRNGEVTLTPQESPYG